MTDFSIEFPRPLMPNVIPMPYLFIEDAKPLPFDVQAFLQSSEHQGIIYLSFGTLMDTFQSDRAEILGAVFARFPKYKFIWRNKGPAPSSLQNNTLMLDWAPQLDLLARSDMKIFITHCGISSTYETVLLGVPFIAMPLFWDQDRNAAKLIERVKSGIHYNFYTMTESSLYTAIDGMLANYNYYNELASKAASISNDKPIKPKDQFLWLANYTIRTNGVPHLLSDVVPRLHLYQSMMLDVVGFIVCVIMATLLITFCVSRFIYRCIC